MPWELCGRLARPDGVLREVGRERVSGRTEEPRTDCWAHGTVTAPKAATAQGHRIKNEETQLAHAMRALLTDGSCSGAKGCICACTPACVQVLCACVWLMRIKG